MDTRRALLIAAFASALLTGAGIGITSAASGPEASERATKVESTITTQETLEPTAVMPVESLEEQVRTLVAARDTALIAPTSESLLALDVDGSPAQWNDRKLWGTLHDDGVAVSSVKTTVHSVREVNGIGQLAEVTSSSETKLSIDGESRTDVADELCAIWELREGKVWSAEPCQ